MITVTDKLVPEFMLLSPKTQVCFAVTRLSFDEMAEAIRAAGHRIQYDVRVSDPNWEALMALANATNSAIQVATPVIDSGSGSYYVVRQGHTRTELLRVDYEYAVTGGQR